jgi:NAD(P)H dehydrogenase (quinone)
MATEPTVHVAIANPAHSVASSVVEVHGAVATVLALQDHDFDDEWWGTLERADAIVFGAFTYIGGPSAVFKRFAEASLPIGVRQGCCSKVAAGFTPSPAVEAIHASHLRGRPPPVRHPARSR